MMENQNQEKTWYENYMKIHRRDTHDDSCSSWHGPIPHTGWWAADALLAGITTAFEQKAAQEQSKTPGKHFKANPADIDMSAVDDFISLILKENTLLKAEIKSLKEKLTESQKKLDALEPLVEKAYGVVIGEAEDDTN